MNIKFPYWQGLLKLLTDMGDGTHAERIEAYPPKVLMTDANGTYARMRVDVGQTGFFAGREAKTFYEFSVPTGQTKVIKVVAPINTIIQNFGGELHLAEMRIELRYGGTEGGTFATQLHIFKTNTMSSASAYTPQITMATGGTHTGGTTVDLIHLFSGSPAKKALDTTVTDDQPQGFAPGTYYIHLVNTGNATATGIFRARWEERP
jgi:hypothetical protein